MTTDDQGVIRVGRDKTPEELQRRPELFRPKQVVESKRTKSAALALYLVASHSCRIALRSRGGLAAWRSDKLQHSGATRY